MKVSPAAIAISDLHLSLTRPACRDDKDWMATQAHYLAQVKDLAGDLPILCAGDIFDRWNPPPELIHFALKHLPSGMLCVPGQHDLPLHRIDLMNRCGYGVLKEAGKIRDLSNQAIKPHMVEGWRGVVYGFGWGQDITPPSPDWKRPFLKIALTHRYCWTEGKGYPGAPDESQASAFREMLDGYDVAVFGDNHISFSASAGDCKILNPGGLIRRRSDETNRNPCVGIIYSDGTVKRQRLDTSIDVFQEVEPGAEENPLNLRDFINGLEELGEHGLNFREAVENHLRDSEVDAAVRQIILTALEPNE